MACRFDLSFPVEDAGDGVTQLITPKGKSVESLFFSSNQSLTVFKNDPIRRRSMLSTT
jgi:hypothetical protein